jgi:hypothetical protein
MMGRSKDQSSLDAACQCLSQHKRAADDAPSRMPRLSELLIRITCHQPSVKSIHRIQSYCAVSQKGIHSYRVVEISVIDQTHRIPRRQSVLANLHHTIEPSRYPLTPITPYRSFGSCPTLTKEMHCSNACNLLSRCFGVYIIVLGIKLMFCKRK